MRNTTIIELTETVVYSAPAELAVFIHKDDPKLNIDGLEYLAIPVAERNNYHLSHESVKEERDSTSDSEYTFIKFDDNGVEEEIDLDEDPVFDEDE